MKMAMVPTTLEKFSSQSGGATPMRDSSLAPGTNNGSTARRDGLRTLVAARANPEKSRLFVDRSGAVAVRLFGSTPRCPNRVPDAYHPIPPEESREQNRR